MSGSKLRAAPLVVGPAALAELRDLRERASLDPVDVRAVLEVIKTPEGDRAHMERMAGLTVAVPGVFDWWVTFTVELGHPVGPCRHMSMSVRRPGRLPTLEALSLVATTLGFTGVLEESCAVWREPLPGGHNALNLVQPLALAPEGHA